MACITGHYRVVLNIDDKNLGSEKLVKPEDLRDIMNKLSKINFNVNFEKGFVQLQLYWNNGNYQSTVGTIFKLISDGNPGIDVSENIMNVLIEKLREFI